MADITEDDLWGSDSPEENPNAECQTLNRTQMAELSPAELIKFERNHENIIYNETHALAVSLEFCDKVVIAAYKVADYIPPLMNDKHSMFWKKQVIPNLVKSLTQHDKALSTISQAFSSIRNLSIIIKRSAYSFSHSKGSRKAIKIAQKEIPLALAEIDDHIRDVSTLEDAVIKVFEQQTTELLLIIGPKAADFVEQKAELENLLNLEYDKTDKFNKVLAEKLDEVTRYNHLINATEKQLNTELSELVECKRRNEHLIDSNKSDGRRVQKNKPVTSSISQIWSTFSGGSLSTTTPQEKNQVSLFDNLLSLGYDQTDKLTDVLAEKIDEVTGSDYLANAAKKQLKNLQSELFESLRRNEDLNSLCQSVETSIRNIQEEIAKTLNSSKRSYFWWTLRGSSMTTITQEEKNKNAEFEKNHYESIMKARTVRLKQNQNDEKAKQEAVNELNKLLADLNGKYAEANTELEKMQETYANRMKERQTEIDNINKQIEELNKSQVTTEDSVGLRGNVLIECLFSVRTFAKSLKGGTSPYSPLFNILSAIKSMVESEVELLTSSTNSDLLIAGTLLMKNVRFLTNYSENSTKVLFPPKDCDNTDYNSC